MDFPGLACFVASKKNVIERPLGEERETGREGGGAVEDILSVVEGRKREPISFSS